MNSLLPYLDRSADRLGLCAVAVMLPQRLGELVEDFTPTRSLSGLKPLSHLVRPLAGLAMVSSLWQGARALGRLTNGESRNGFHDLQSVVSTLFVGANLFAASFLKGKGIAAFHFATFIGGLSFDLGALVFNISEGAGKKDAFLQLSLLVLFNCGRGDRSLFRDMFRTSAQKEIVRVSQFTGFEYSPELRGFVARGLHTDPDRVVARMQRAGYRYIGEEQPWQHEFRRGATLATVVESSPLAIAALDYNHEHALALPPKTFSLLPTGYNIPPALKPLRALRRELGREARVLLPLATDEWEVRAFFPRTTHVNIDREDMSFILGRRRVAADLMRLPFADASFDLVVIHSSFSLIGNPFEIGAGFLFSEAASQELKRCLRPGGLILLTSSIPSGSGDRSSVAIELALRHAAGSYYTARGFSYTSGISDNPLQLVLRKSV